MPTTVPVGDDIFVWPSDTATLLGSRCTNCGNHMFPVQDGCPKCMSSESETVELGRRGTLWSWTIQGFPPKAPPYQGPVGDEFRPYGVGYVELPGEVRVESRLTEADPEKLHIGMEMELVFDRLGTDDDGNELITYAFAPVEEAAS